MKTCTTCKEPKESSEFTRQIGAPDGLRYACKSCARLKAQKIGPDGLTDLARWRKNNPEWCRGYARKYNYGISIEQFTALLCEQGNVCAICKRPDRRWNVDHDHASGKIRGILCSGCNTAIGILCDSSSIATAAAGYLSKHGK